MTHENYQEMLAAQALNALEVDEARRLDSHLKSCSECNSQLSHLQDTAACLAFVALEDAPLEPAEHVRARILQAIASEPRSGKTPHVRGSDQSTGVIPFQRQIIQKWKVDWVAIAAGILLVLSAASLLVLWRQNRAAQTERARLADQAQRAERELAQLYEAIELISAPGTRMSELAGTSEMPGAYATLAFDKGGRALLMAKGLPPPPAGKAYQLWFIAGGRPMPGKTFTTDSSGTGMMNDQIPAQAMTSAVYAVTLEPEQGVSQPTGAMYLKSRF